MDPALISWITDTAGVVGGLSIIALVFVWREWRKEAAAKDALYERQLERDAEILEDYHDFAHSINALAEAFERQGSAGSVAEER